MQILLTGGAGFIGSNFVRWALDNRPDYTIINLDVLSYSANLENLAGLEDHPRYRFVKGDVCDMETILPLCDEADAVIHMAAESHVDRSIMDPSPFVQSNTLGTQTMLEAWKRTHGPNTKRPARFVYVSTDEVYGSLPLEPADKRFTEDSPIAPNSAYSASKAAGDLFARAYHHTFGLDVVTTRCSNNFGPYQFPEKVIPLFVTNLIRGESVPLYGDGLNVRDWIHVDDHCEAVMAALEHGKRGEVYNIGSDNERTNLELTHMILEIMGEPESRIRHVEDRLGHDRRYAIDSSKARRDLNWRATRSRWPEALANTVRWYKDNTAWWERVRSGAYRDYYAAQYGDRMV